MLPPAGCHRNKFLLLCNPLGHRWETHRCCHLLGIIGMNFCCFATPLPYGLSWCIEGIVRVSRHGWLDGEVSADLRHQGKLKLRVSRVEWSKHPTPTHPLANPYPKVSGDPACVPLATRINLYNREVYKWCDGLCVYCIGYMRKKVPQC